MGKIWIFNHYATDMYRNRGGRHYWLAKELLKKGYKVTIFCSSTEHNIKENIQIKNKYIIKNLEGIDFVFIKTNDYKSNGVDRIINMIQYYFGLITNYKYFIKEVGLPNIIYGSSVHPLALVAGIQISSKLRIPCISEVRDLWPESLVEYGVLKKNSLITNILYRGEKWIYKKSNAIIMTWEGGKDYIIDQGWDNEIDIEKVYHINNGVDLEEFNNNRINNIYNDIDLDNSEIIKLVYTGSIRKVNNLNLIVELSRKFVNSKIKFIIFGDGDEKENLVNKVENYGLKNIIFKGRVEKKYIPSILSKADILLLHNSSTNLDKYGQSQNKFFEYLASSKPILQTYTSGYSINNRYKCGVDVKNQNIDEIYFELSNLINNDLLREEISENSKKAIENYTFSNHVNKLIKIINSLGDNYET